MGRYFTGFPLYVVHPCHLRARGATVAVLGTTTGSHLGLPDDEEQRLDVLWLAEVTGGRLSRWEVAEATPAALAMAGIPIGA